MSEENKLIIRRLAEEVLARGNLSLIPELFAPDYVPHDPSSPDRGGGVDGVRRFVGMLHTGLSDVRYVVEDMIAEGDRVVYRWSLQGKHTGAFMGVAPTGSTLSVSGVDIFRISGGKIAESWVIADALGMLRQLGALPAPPAGQVPPSPPSGGGASASPKSGPRSGPVSANPKSANPVSANPVSAVPPTVRTV